MQPSNNTVNSNQQPDLENQLVPVQQRSTWRGREVSRLVPSANNDGDGENSNGKRTSITCMMLIAGIIMISVCHNKDSCAPGTETAGWVLFGLSLCPLACLIACSPLICCLISKDGTSRPVPVIQQKTPNPTPTTTPQYKSINREEERKYAAHENQRPTMSNSKSPHISNAPSSKPISFTPSAPTPARISASEQVPPNPPAFAPTSSNEDASAKEALNTNYGAYFYSLLQAPFKLFGGNRNEPPPAYQGNSEPSSVKVVPSEMPQGPAAPSSAPPPSYAEATAKETKIVITKKELD